MAEHRHTTKKRVLISAGVLALAVALGCLYFAWGSPPQMGPDEEVFAGVDALFTAVTAHDERLLDQCARRLSSLSEAGKLPPEASAHLDGIIAKARTGRWQASAEKLYVFMMAQRREGAIGHAKHKHRPVQQVAHRR